MSSGFPGPATFMPFGVWDLVLQVSGLKTSGVISIQGTRMLGLIGYLSFGMGFRLEVQLENYCLCNRTSINFSLWTQLHLKISEARDPEAGHRAFALQILGLKRGTHTSLGFRSLIKVYVYIYIHIHVLPWHTLISSRTVSTVTVKECQRPARLCSGEKRIFGALPPPKSRKN